jgi:hypothetical protein
MRTTKLQHSIKNDRKPFDKEYIDMELSRHMIIIVPSTQGQRHVSKSVIDSRARDVASKLTEDFGGSTRIRGQGQYTNMKYHTIDDEDVVQVEVFMTPKQWTKHKRDIEKYLHNKKKEWNQQDLAVEYDKTEKMYFIK